MTDRRFFCELAQVRDGDTLVLPSETLRHIRVLRLREGCAITLFDGRGRVASATQQDGQATIDHLHSIETPVTLGLIQGLPKAKKADEIVRMATELGVTDLVFVPVSRSVLPMDKAKRRVERWNRIARESSRQSERDHEPSIQLASSLSEAFARISERAQRFLCWARGQNSTKLAEAPELPRWVAVGPEGGFAEDELSALREADFQPLALGPHILRVDTAAAAALALLNRKS